MASCEPSEPIQFPDVTDECFKENRGFNPVQAHNDFCEEYGVGVILLHSHDGVSELTYTENFAKSRPATSEDKKGTAACSFFFDANGSLIPFEWVHDSTPGLLSPMPADMDRLYEDLQALCRISGVALGFTLQPASNRLEVDIEGQPGSHAYLDPSIEGSTARDIMLSSERSENVLTTMMHVRGRAHIDVSDSEIEIAKERGPGIIQHKRWCIVHANGHFCKR